MMFSSHKPQKPVTQKRQKKKDIEEESSVTEQRQAFLNL